MSDEMKRCPLCRHLGGLAATPDENWRPDWILPVLLLFFAGLGFPERGRADEPKYEEMKHQSDGMCVLPEDTDKFGEGARQKRVEEQETPVEHCILPWPGETVRLHSRWSGLSVEELKFINDGKLPTFGINYTLFLTASEFLDFQRRRHKYWDKRKKEMYDNYEVKAVVHVVMKNDNLDGLCRKYDVPLWFLMLHNKEVDPYHMTPGLKLIVPTLKNRSEPVS